MARPSGRWGAIPVAFVILGAAARAGAGAAAGDCTLQLAGAGEPGTPLVVSGRIVDRAGAPVAGAALHVYQTDAGGRYTPDRPMDEPHARLAGRLVTCADGGFELRTVRPGGYPQPVRLDGVDRRIPAHIHLDLTAEGHAARRLQMVFGDDPLLRDPYWKDWVARLGQPVLQPRAAAAGQAGLTAAVTIAVE